MKTAEVMAKAVRGELRWIDAAGILGISDRQMRRWRQRFEVDGHSGLKDRRFGRIPGNRVPLETVQRVLELYRSDYAGFNVRHFWEELTATHGIEVSYSWTKGVLVHAGYVKRYPRKRVYRRKRERKPMRGMLVHLDGSKHRWFESPDGAMQDMLVMLDDATGDILDGAFVPEESTTTVLEVIKTVVRGEGTFGALYVDRASHFVYTPAAGEEPDRSKKTQVERILDELGIELIAAFSPQARGRSERLWRTLQGRLPQELKKEGIATYEQATTYFRSRYIAKFNRRFGVSAQEAGSAFVPVSGVDLDRLFTLKHERTVNADHTIRFNNRVLQLPRTPAQLPRRKVAVRIDLLGNIEVFLGVRLLARFGREEGETLDVAA